MASVAGSDVPLHQLLFGYQDGHRQLAGSTRIPDDSSNQLLLASDLVPGVNPDIQQGYLTGLPLPSLKAYGLMRTWAAPEMPRPGCVWSHVLLINQVDMARIADLGALRGLLRRPSLNEEFSSYSKPLLLAPSPCSVSSAPSETFSRALLQALYGADADGRVPEGGLALEDALFAVWSQQWPRLRRGFSFQTAASLSGRNRSTVDLTVTLSSKDISSIESAARWEKAALDDLLVGGSELKRFLWRYGSDLRDGRKQFRFLVDLYLETRGDRLSGRGLKHALDQVVKALPVADDGGQLKEDILSSGQSAYSLFPIADPIDVLDYFVTHPRNRALTLPSATAFETIPVFWPARAVEMLAIAERALHTRSELADALLDRIAELVEPASFLELTAEHVEVRTRVTARRPELLDNPGLADIPADQRASLIEMLPDDPVLARRVVGHLLWLDDPELAQTLTRRFFDVVVEAIHRAISHHLAGRGAPVASVWLKTLHDNIIKPSPARLLGMSNKLSEMAGCAALLHWDVRAGLGVPPTQWAAVLTEATDDLDGANRERILAYLLALALHKPSRGCEPIFERAFDPIHKALWQSHLPYDVFAWLSPELPDLFWWQQWDSCLRLRLGVVRSYVRAELAPASFVRLTKELDVRERLLSAASDSKEGRRFLKLAGK